jgi:hypothetical protein
MRNIPINFLNKTTGAAVLRLLLHTPWMNINWMKLKSRAQAISGREHRFVIFHISL